jgi:Raf kinase inhibitor-like YbhB/YbcL family protein
MFTLTSTAFDAGAAIPGRHTCDGPNLSPPLAWQGVPDDTRSFALIVDDPDAPDPKAPKMVWVHWVIYNISRDLRGLPEGASAKVVSGAHEGRNDGGGTGYTGPCPPIGRHRYFHKLYALDTMLPDLGRDATKPDLERAMQGHVLATAELMGTYDVNER